MITVSLSLQGIESVTIEASVRPAEYDVGIMSPYVNDWNITEINEKPCRGNIKRLMHKIACNPKELDCIYDLVLETYSEEGYD
jgi:hypothetical protein